MRRRILPLLLVPLVLSCEAVMKENPDPGAPGGVPTTSGQLDTPPNPCTGCALVPTTFTRTDGQTKPYVREFSGDPAADYLLIVQDDGQEGTRAEIKLNGETVVASSALYGLKVAEIKKSVVLQASNRLTVLPLGKVGARVVVWIELIPPPPVPTTIVSGAVAASELGGGYLSLATVYGQSGGLSNGQASVRVSGIGTQVVAALGGRGELRGLSLTIVAGGQPVMLPMGAASTVLSLLYMNPGIVATDPVVAQQHITSVQSLPCFASVVGQIKPLLATTPLTQVIQQPAVTDLLVSCALDYFAAYPAVLSPILGAANPTFITSADQFRITRDPPGAPDRVFLENAGWRYVMVSRQDVGGPFSSAHQPVTPALGMSGYVAASWGSIATVTISNPTSIFDPTFSSSATSSAPLAEYWVQGLGFQAPTSAVPQGLPSPDLTYVETGLFYGLFPLLDAISGGAASPGTQTLQCVANSTKALLSVTSFRYANEFNALLSAPDFHTRLSRATNLIILLSSDLSVLPSAGGVNCAANLGGSWLAGLNGMLGAWNFVGAVVSWSRVSRATFFQVPRVLVQTGSVGGTVTSAQIGPLAGVTVSASPGSLTGTTTGANAGYQIDNIPSGPATLTLTGLPVGCQDPGSRQTTIVAAASIQEDFDVTCATPLPDLVPTFLSVPSSVVAGGQFLVDATVVNRGLATTPSGVVVVYYLSQDNLSLIGAGDLSVGGSQLAQSIAPAAGFDISQARIDIPAFVQPGIYYLKVFVDVSGLVAEESETNNVLAAGSFNVQASTGTGTLLYSDDFSAGLGNWVQHGSGGSWTTPGGELIGDYGVNCGRVDCSQSQLVLVDALQPGASDWRMEVQSGLVQAYCCTVMVNLGKFVLYVSDLEKEAFDAGQSWPSGTVPTTATTAYGAHQAYPWTSIGFSTVTVPSWSPSAWQTVAFEKRGNQYTLFFNGVQVYQATRTFSSPPKVGFATYGKVRMDNFKLYRLP